MSISQSRKIVWLFFILIALVLTSACGQKGDLYHPDEKQSSLSFSRLPA